MSQLQVAPETLVASSAAAGRLGSGLKGLAPNASAVGQGDGLPSATAGALASFGASAGRHVTALGEATESLGAAVGAAAELYRVTDDTVMT